ncbi:ATP-binding protein [Nitrosopumilus ureiphilus]|uniref:histidine kinase n=1 Tax=Nitrosopumilus ureiphilus TaxID=1470067 RepID=A0A7D5RFN8_9ARCH|nr:ATP-binding protein [Nitrosopumilus ureiphilus]QLH05845.1 hypothetical protein C5F50_01180 [Nitrosopumilus ureiphilus]
MKIAEKISLLILFFSVVIISSGIISLSYLHNISLPLENEIPMALTGLSDSSHLLSHAYLIEYYDEVLTQSARNYAFTQNIMWKERYYENEPKLNFEITSALEDGTDKTNNIFSQINDANIRLVELEHISLNLVDDDKSEEAIIVLESTEYWNLKQKYQKGLIEFRELTNTQYSDATETSLITLESVTLMTSKQTQTAFQSTIILIFIFLIVTTSFSYFSLKSTTLSITELRNNVNKITTKNLDINLEPSGDDEIKDLAKDIKIMYDELIANEKKLLKNERSVAIGELSARLAHDLRNPLSVLKTSLENIKLAYGEKNNLVQSYKRMDNAIERMTHQLEEVMDFVREKPITLTSNSLFDILDSSINALNVPESVKITYPKDDLTINCDPHLMSTVFLNIILNGIQAIDEKGQIDISASQDDDSLKIIFTNSGSPIPPEILSKIFDPLFTTKQKGTGLGLASCKTIVESHGGSIRVNNNPTSFKIILPKPTKII